MVEKKTELNWKSGSFCCWKLRCVLYACIHVTIESSDNNKNNDVMWCELNRNWCTHAPRKCLWFFIQFFFGFFSRIIHFKDRKMKLFLTFLVCSGLFSEQKSWRYWPFTVAITFNKIATTTTTIWNNRNPWKYYCSFFLYRKKTSHIIWYIQWNRFPDVYIIHRMMKINFRNEK